MNAQLAPRDIQSDPLAARALWAAMKWVDGEPLTVEDWEALHAQAETQLREVTPLPEF